MKKILVVIIAMVFIGISAALADGTKTCPVNGTTGSVEVSVYNGDMENGTASLSFSNDTDVDVNVRYTIAFTLKNGSTVTRSGSKRVAQHSESSGEVSIGQAYTRVTVSSLSGQKCS